MKKLRIYLKNKRDFLKAYFKENLIAYSYLFFAQISATIVSTYLHYQALHPPTSSIHAWQWENTFIFFLPTIFIFASIVTLDQSSLKTPGKIIATTFNFFLFAIVLFYVFSIKF